MISLVLGPLGGLLGAKKEAFGKGGNLSVMLMPPRLGLPERALTAATLVHGAPFEALKLFPEIPLPHC